MKKIFLSFLLIAVAALCAVAAGKEGKAAISFSSTRHDFGTIGDDKQVTAVYEFENTGTAPLVIISVTNGGCGCPRPSFTKKPIKPGEKGEISIKFDPRGRAGEFNREVKVKTNAGGSRKKLTFSGTIIPSRK